MRSFLCASSLAMGGCLVVGSGCGSASPEPSASQMFTLSKRSYDSFRGIFRVTERFVVAFPDGTYSTDVTDVFEEDVDPPGTGSRTGEWMLDDGELLTRASPADPFRSQYFPGHRADPVPQGYRSDGCFTSTTVNLLDELELDDACFGSDGTYRLGKGLRASPPVEVSSEGTYELDGHRLVLTSSAATVVRTAFALLAGTKDAPTSVSIGTGRFSEPEPE